MSFSYGIIGNCKTAALISRDGSIDWLCMPRFDSHSTFAALLDSQKGGKFQIATPSSPQIIQTYLPETNILQTEFDQGEHAFAIIDFMPRFRSGQGYCKPLEIHRILKPLRGKPTFRVLFEPKLDYARGETTITAYENLITAHKGFETLFLYSSLPTKKIISGEIMVLDKEEYLLLSYHEKMDAPNFSYSHEMMTKTKEYWEGWSRHCHLPTIGTNMVLRSALTLKMLTYEDTGAILAAVTTSLPEIMGESRNWDYRYCWLRDSSLIIESLKSIGHFEEAGGFIRFLLHLFENKQTKIQILYGIDGRTHLDEQILDHLCGYKNSSPVRIGNNAWLTNQNDIFGEIIYAIYLYYGHYQFEKMPEEVWSLVKFLVGTIAIQWQNEDAGIWEYRNQKKHFTFSKVLSWVALDRGVKIANQLGKIHMAKLWDPIAQEIKKDIQEKGWNPEIGSYTQFYGSRDLDASLLLMRHYGFLQKTDPQWLGLVRACEKKLMKNGFTLRYTHDDDFGTPKNAFIVASLWMAKAFHSIGEKEKALSIFEKITTYANHLGLLSECIDVESGELIGNFPQAYSHLAIISTANYLSQPSMV
ncbi:MAG: hypothetical protein A2048_08925 [Deltaproteobacteria bacterium GWA2_45_12]|nr:MAG: hypothetical protein A2048_08925 [Deltaproteobacteria bacterium GWA2_45_12]